MRLFVAIVLGVLASFAFTILCTLLMFSKWMPQSVSSVFLVLPPLLVGVLVALIARHRARLAAALSLTPWAIWMILATNAKQSTPSRWVTTIAIVLVLILLGIGAAAFVGGRMTRLTASVRNSGHEKA